MRFTNARDQICYFFTMCTREFAINVMLDGTTRFLSAVSLLTFAACTVPERAALERPEPIETSHHQKPFRAIVSSYPWSCPTITASLDRSRMVGAGNVKYFGWTDEIAVWEIPQLARLATVELIRKENFDGKPVVVHCPRLSSDGKRLLYEDGLESFVIRDVLDAENATRFSRDSIFGAELQFRVSGKELVSLLTKPMDQDEDDVGVHVVIHDLDTGRNRQQFLGRVYQLPSISQSLGSYRYDWTRQKEGLSFFRISPQGNLIAFFRIPENEQTGTVEVWNIEPWKRMVAIDATFGLGSLTFSDNENRLAVVSTGSSDSHGDRNNLIVIDIPSSEVLINVESTGEPNHSYFADFSPDGTRLATGTRNNGVQIWDVTSGKRIGYARLGDGRRPATYTTGLVFSRDATELYAINASGELRTASLAHIIASPGIH